MKCLVLILLVLPIFSSEVAANQNINDKRAKFNYQILCQGCHVGDGRGGKGVPNMKGRVGYFLSGQKGREYLVKVPGAANSALDNDQLAELLNWMMIEIGKKSTPADFAYFTAPEVERLRASPLFEAQEYRKQLVKKLFPLAAQ
ncbi:MAG: cytochrome c553 [Paraglaciecola sp.]|jgi:cytochrome c553